MKTRKSLTLFLSLCLISIAAMFLLTACGGGNSTPNGGGNSTPNGGGNSKPTSITLSESSVNMFIGETHQLYATVSPLDNNAKITWTSLNTEVVTIDNNGKVTALSQGTGVIRANTENNLVASCTINVNQAVGNLTVDVTYAANAGTLADKNAKIYLIPEDLKSFPTDFNLYVTDNFKSYGIISGNTDTSGKKTFNDVPAGKYRVIIESANAKYGSQTMLDIVSLTDNGEKIIKNVFGDNLYQKLQALKNYFVNNSDSITQYKKIASSMSFNIHYGKTVEIKNGATESLSKHFGIFEGGN